MDLETGILNSDDGFYYKLSVSKRNGKLEFLCIGHPMLAPEELYLVDAICQEAYKAYLTRRKALN